jgi:hypothetical protein
LHCLGALKRIGVGKSIAVIRACATSGSMSAEYLAEKFP